ncbi:probable E3 ubiquitin-protein ligase HERC4 isoform X1 [Tigriopus californicus]|uniref:probable E3 ubiquitin-protein ligase HERC4 isoform X1 n=1 Tax=Tigriopus californicus TaxID=6832 RepID=UPI0027D9E8CB|nr:probable E3 ubiquitin-protein ligase HERC4 isoform X1 [Tigriopus californicus]
MITLYSWGRGDQGQLGLGGGLESPYVSVPRNIRHVPWISEKADDELGSTRRAHVAQIDSGDEHTAVLMSNGSVFICGSNDMAQLGHDQSQSRFERIESLSPYKVTHLACGGKHTLALEQWGKVFSWGSDDRGQLGQNSGEEKWPMPKIIRGLAHLNVVQVACGWKHSLVLTNNGRLFAFGDNTYGQLGLGNDGGDRVLTPQPIESLSGLPIKKIACGGYHCVVVTMSGAVFAWGRNNHGQVGVDGNESKFFPVQIRSLRSQNVAHVACGDEHTVCLTQFGGVFSFGCGRYGQLGHGSWNNEQSPRQVMELMGTEVSQVACGKRQTLAFVPSRGRLYAFGLAGSGQLGSENTSNSNTPQVVHGSWVSPMGNMLKAIKRSISLVEQEQLVLFLVGAGGDQSFGAVCPRFFAEQNRLAIDMRKTSKSASMQVISSDIQDFFRTAKPDQSLDQDLLEILETIFSSTSCLNGSLLTSTHQPCSSKNSGIDFKAWIEFYSIVKSCPNKTLVEIVENGIIQSIIPKLKQTPPDVETLRVFLTLPLFHKFDDPTMHEELQTPFANNLISLDKNPWNVIEKWISQQDKSYLKGLVQKLKNVARHILKSRSQSSTSNRRLETSLVLLRILNRINVDQNLIIDYEDFYIPEVSECLDLVTCYARWLALRSEGGTEFSICNYPFVFDAVGKSILLHVDQAFQMQKAVHEARSTAMLSNFFVPIIDPDQTSFLILHVSRDNIVTDTLTQIRLASRSDLKKPLKIRFQGEEAEDAGGVRKEFFLLILKELLDPKYGMFKEYEETRTIWFHPLSFEEDQMFFIIGVVCGLAIYNFTIINLPFPLPLYKKLLGDKVGNLDDLATLSPTIAKGLQDVLAYDKDDLEDVFCLNFALSEEHYGELKTLPLKSGGENIPVTQSNKKEYVDLHCQFVLNESIKKRFDAFKQGFDLVCAGRVLELFHAHELMAVVVGNQNYDWDELEKTTEYKNGYTKDHPTIQNFWSVFHNDLTEDDKRKFLLFLTGCDRIPNTGMKSLSMVIQRTLNVHHLPVAHTCFNILDLPEYATREKLHYKLLKAIQHTSGFGLV